MVQKEKVSIRRPIFNVVIRLQGVGLSQEPCICQCAPGEEDEMPFSSIAFEDS